MDESRRSRTARDVGRGNSVETSGRDRLGRTAHCNPSRCEPTLEGAPLVRAVIAMGKSLGCRIVAEGVETKHQFAYLRSEHCDEGQGFHFSPPVNAEAFARLLADIPFAIPILEN